MPNQIIGPRERALQEMRERRFGGLQAKAVPIAKVKKQVARIKSKKRARRK